MKQVPEDPSGRESREAHEAVKAPLGTHIAETAETDFRERAAIFDHNCSGCPFPSPHLKGARLRNAGPRPSRDSNAAKGNTQDMDATLANLLRKECQGCKEAEGQAAPPHVSNLPERLPPPSRGFS